MGVKYISLLGMERNAIEVGISPVLDLLEMLLIRQCEIKGMLQPVHICRWADDFLKPSRCVAYEEGNIICSYIVAKSTSC